MSKVNAGSEEIRRVLSARGADGQPTWEGEFLGPDGERWGAEHRERAAKLGGQIRRRVKPQETVVLDSEELRACAELRGAGPERELLRLDPRVHSARILRVQTRLCLYPDGRFVEVSLPDDRCQVEVIPRLSEQPTISGPIELPLRTLHIPELGSRSPIALSEPVWRQDPGSDPALKGRRG